jgi:hypothetical protein
MARRGFWFYRSRRARYDYFEGRKVRGRSLSDEWFGKKKTVKQSKRDRDRERVLRKDVLHHVRDYAKRGNKRTPRTDVPEQ